MSRRSRRRLSAAVLAVALLGGAGGLVLGGTQEHAAPTSRPTIVMDDAALLDAVPAEAAVTLRTARQLGVDWVRVTARWAAIAPTPASPRLPVFAADDPAAYPPAGWEALDRVVREARRRGLRTMIDIAGAPPRWAAVRREREYARFALAVARRYSGRFRELPAAVAFAVGERPNQAMPGSGAQSEGQVTAVADRYRAVVHAAVPAIRRAAPGSLVLLGNTTASISPGAQGGAPQEFLRAVACVAADGRRSARRGCRGFRPLPGDGWAHQVISDRASGGNGRALAGLAPIAGLLARLHRQGRLASRMPLYLTAHAPDARAGNYAQARSLAEAEWLTHRIPGVRGFAQAPLRDRPGRAGLQLADGTPKPALAAFAFPLVVHRAGPQGVRIWGRVRPRAARGRFRVAVRLVEGVWRSLPQFRRARSTDDDGYFEVQARTGPGGTPIDLGSTFRLEVLDRELGWRPAGLPVFGAAPPPSG